MCITIHTDSVSRERSGKMILHDNRAALRMAIVELVVSFIAIFAAILVFRDGRLSIDAQVKE